MSAIYKFALFFIIFGIILLIGYLLFRYLNKKIRGSETGLELVGYTLLMLFVNLVLLVGGLVLLATGYEFLANVE